MPGCARSQIVREGEIGIYHTWSRCVQKAFLCGEDPETRIDFDYRREWIKALLEYQASVFAVDVGNYSILSNHQHLIARTRPDVAAQWNDEEVVWRWKLAWPAWVDGQWIREPTDEEIEAVLALPEQIPDLRANLSSLSWFMARWKEPIARLANSEMDRKGHFYEQRFGSREILDDAANLCCNVYVDLNQIKAGMAGSLEESRCSAIHDRLQAWRREEALASVEVFQTQDAPGCSLQVTDVERLLADCFLAPIGDQHPPLQTPICSRLILAGLPGTTTIQESPPPPPSAESTPSGIAADDTAPESVSEFDADTRGPRVDEDPAIGTASASVPIAAPSTGGTGHRRRQPQPRPTPTRKMHARLQSRRRRRASDQAYLGLPRQQYLDLVRCTAERTLARSTESNPSLPLPDTVAQTLQQWGISVDHWCEAIEKFEHWFHRAVGHVDRLLNRIERNKQRWIQGIRPCRQVFT